MGGKEREGRRRVWMGEVVVVGCVEWTGTGTGRRKKACPRGNGGEEEGLVQQRQRQHLQQQQEQQQQQHQHQQSRVEQSNSSLLLKRQPPRLVVAGARAMPASGSGRGRPSAQPAAAKGRPLTPDAKGGFDVPEGPSQWHWPGAAGLAMPGLLCAGPMATHHPPPIAWAGAGHLQSIHPRSHPHCDLLSRLSSSCCSSSLLSPNPLPLCPRPFQCCNLLLFFLSFLSSPCLGLSAALPLSEPCKCGSARSEPEAITDLRAQAGLDDIQTRFFRADWQRIIHTPCRDELRPRRSPSLLPTCRMLFCFSPHAATASTLHALPRSPGNRLTQHSTTTEHKLHDPRHARKSQHKPIYLVIASKTCPGRSKKAALDRLVATQAVAALFLVELSPKTWIPHYQRLDYQSLQGKGSQQAAGMRLASISS